MKVWRIWQFTFVCLTCAYFGWLRELKPVELICLAEECLAVALFLRDKFIQRLSHKLLGILYKRIRDHGKAIEHYEKYLMVANEMGSDMSRDFGIYKDLGDLYYLQSNFHKATNYHDKCLSIAKEMGYKRREGLSNRCLGKDYQSLGNYYKAIECHEKCLSIALEIGDRKIEGDVYVCLASAYESLGKYQTSIEYQEKHLGIASEMSDRLGEAGAYGNIGVIYLSLGEFEKAIECQEKRRRIAIEIGDKKGEGSACGNLGVTYLAIGKHRQAIECGEMQLNIAKEVGDRKGEQSAYVMLGSVFKALGKYNEAIEYQKNSLDIAIEDGDIRAKIATYGELGNTHRSLRKYQEALEYYEKALEIAMETDDRAGESTTYGNIGQCYTSLAMEQDGDQHTNLKEAEGHLKKSIQSSESLFDDLEQDQYKVSFVDTFIAAYKTLAHVYVQKQQTEEALLVLDQGRARALRDLLTMKYSIKKETRPKRRSIEPTDIEDMLLTCRFDILFFALQLDRSVYIWVLAHRRSLYFCHTAKKELKFSKKHSSENNSEEEEDDNDVISKLVENSYDKMKVREGMKCEDRSLEVLQVKDQDFEKDSVSSKVSEQNPTEADENGTADGTNTRCIHDEDHDDGENVLELLYDILVAPVQHKLVQEEIVIIPDGPLYMVPYAAFQDPKTGQFLSETKRIRLAPSLTTLNVLQHSLDDHHQRSGALIIGNPELGRVKFEGSERSFTDLPGAETEAIEIAQLLGVEPLIGKQANKEAVVHKLQVGVSVIHFAAHGSQENGQILLAPSASSATNGIPNEQDYILTMEEAQESGIRAQLVVLSCCHSGRGEIKAEGVVGMSRAFLAAGARAVVASLWAIDDDATKVFMLKFYSHLKRGESASRSLQQAMQDMRETTRYKEPRYWAAFFLIGDDVTISV